MSKNSPSQPKPIDTSILVSSVAHLMDIQNEDQHNRESSTGKKIIHTSNIQQNRQIRFESKRKIKPKSTIRTLHQSFSLHQRMNKIQSMTNKCFNGFNENDEITKENTWIYHEYFLPNSDQEFFQNQQMAQIFQQLQLNKIEITFSNFLIIKKSMPKPKLFRKEFISKSIQSLKSSRKSKMKRIKKGIINFDTKSYISLQAQDSVWALHPVCKHLHSGKIMAFHKDNIYFVKFHKPQLGVYKLPDEAISSLFLNSAKNNLPFYKNIQGSGPQSLNINLQNIDFQILASYIKFIELKEDLINSLHSYHQLASKLRVRGQILQESALQEYGWIGSLISLTNMILKYMNNYYPFPTQKSSIRGEKHIKIPQLFPNPLYVQISSGATLSDESEQKKQRRQVRNSSSQSIMILNEKQSNQSLKVENMIEKISSKNSNLLESIEESEEKKEIENIIKNLLGILSGIQDRGRSFNSVQDKYLTQLDTLIGKKYPQHFNDIYDMIRSVLRKLPS